MTQERTMTAGDGWTMLFVNLGLLLFAPVSLIIGAVNESPTLIIIGILSGITAVISFCGHFTLQPNTSCVLSFFGPYIGTVREPGFYWVNPFYTKKHVSLRIRNFDSAK